MFIITKAGFSVNLFQKIRDISAFAVYNGEKRRGFMTQLSQDILATWQVRKTKKQKTAFIEMMRQRFPEMQVTSGGFPNSRNLILGDLNTARVIYTAHYDTCARLPFPNFITPKNFWLYLGYQILIAAPFIALLLLVKWLVGLLGGGAMLSFWLGYLAMMFSMAFVFMGGPANKHTANDNTSGVITLVELYCAMTPQQRSKAAFVFFDNEENGLLGSSALKSVCKKQGIQNRLLVNFDCVSDGDYIMLVLKKKANKAYRELFQRCFQPEGRKQILLETEKTAFYPSDQKNFDLGVGVAALKKGKRIGYYMDKIHTAKDTAFDEANISLLVKSSLQLTDQL